MRFWLSGATAAVLLASMAPAGAQMSSAPPPPPPMAPPMVMGMTNWTGFYLGANLGGGEADSHYSFTAPLGTTVKHSGDFNLGGPLGGGTTGFNWELSNGFLLGVEGDFDGSGINGSKLCGAGGAYVCGTNSKWLATARGRVGWAPGMGNMLWYVTGGGAWGEIKTKITGPTPAAGNSDSTRSGWTVGGGGEYMLTPQWSLKVEYRYLDLGAKFETANIGLAGLNFHFGAPPPPPPAPMAAPAPPPAAPKVFIVFFDWDKDTITPEGHQIIVQAADAYKAGAPVQIQVTGYTDRSGSPGYNQRLSERRANNVAKAMAALGVPKDQMIVTGRGENDNRVPTAPGVREPQNRRVEIVEP